MKNEPVRGMPSQVLIGLFVIGMGVFFLLDNMNIIDMRITFFPALLVLIGTIKLMDYQSQGSRIVGGAFIAIGAAIALRQMGYLDFNPKQLWPLILIGVGGAVVWKALVGRRDIGNAVVKTDADGGDDSVVNATAIVGGFKRRIVSPNFRGGEVTAVMGGCEIDLRGSSIQGEAVINVFAAMGGIEFKVPTDWTVILHGTPILGGFDEKTMAPPDASKRLVIKGYAIMGGVEVRN